MGGPSTPPTIEEYRARLPANFAARWIAPDFALTPVVSVITPVLNAEENLERCIKGVLGQSYSIIEHIIVDGGSTDGSVDIMRRYRDNLACVLSEPDRGISDAFNKGIALSVGKYISILNADDWMSSDQIGNAVETLDRTNADFVFGDLCFYSEGQAQFRIYGDPDYARKINLRMPAINHPTVMMRRECYERYGLFYLAFRYAMDYELLLRFHRMGAKGVYDRRIVGYMTLGGTSDRNYIGSLRECRTISVLHGASAIPAWNMFLYSVFKAWVRRLLQKFLPRMVLDAVWRGVNSQRRPMATGR